MSILEDTLLGFLLPSCKGSSKKKATAKAKFFMLDIGVANVLAGSNVSDRTAVRYLRQKF